MNDLKRKSRVRKAMTVGQVRTVLLAALVASLFAAVGVFHTSVRVSVVRSGYELGQVEKDYRKLLRENERLKLERATLRSASRLESIARSRLGMTSPTARQIVAISLSQPTKADSASPDLMATAMIPARSSR